MILDHAIRWTAGKRTTFAVPEDGLRMNGHTILPAGVNATRLETVDALARIGRRIAPDAELLFVPSMWAPLEHLGRAAYIDRANACHLDGDFKVIGGQRMLRAAGLFVQGAPAGHRRAADSPRILVSLSGIYALIARIMLHECGHYAWACAMDNPDRLLAIGACRSSVPDCTAWSAEFRNHLSENPQEWFCDAFADWAHLRLYRPASPPPGDDLERLFARIFGDSAAAETEPAAA